MLKQGKFVELDEQMTYSDAKENMADNLRQGILILKLIGERTVILPSEVESSAFTMRTPRLTLIGKGRYLRTTLEGTNT